MNITFDSRNFDVETFVYDVIEVLERRVIRTNEVYDSWLQKLRRYKSSGRNQIIRCFNRIIVVDKYQKAIFRLLLFLQHHS